MELRRQSFVYSELVYHALNRTYVELRQGLKVPEFFRRGFSQSYLCGIKTLDIRSNLFAKWSLNRTYVELRQFLRSLFTALYLALNRTYVELRPTESDTVYFSSTLSIVPMWN